MGQFIFAGVTHSITIKKSELEKYNIDKNGLIKSLDNEIDISCYDLIDFDDYIEFRGKEDIFNPNTLAGFIKEQCVLFQTDTKKIEEIYNTVNSLTSYEEIVRCAKPKPYANFQEHSGKYSVKYGYWDYFSVEIKSIIFFIEGKAYLECYGDLFDYMTGLIKKSSNYKMANMVQMFLE